MFSKQNQKFGIMPLHGKWRWKQHWVDIERTDIIVYSVYKNTVPKPLSKKDLKNLRAKTNIFLLAHFIFCFVLMFIITDICMYLKFLFHYDRVG